MLKARDGQFAEPRGRNVHARQAALVLLGRCICWDALALPCLATFAKGSCRGRNTMGFFLLPAVIYPM